MCYNIITERKGDTKMKTSQLRAISRYYTEREEKLRIQEIEDLKLTRVFKYQHVWTSRGFLSNFHKRTSAFKRMLRVTEEEIRCRIRVLINSNCHSEKLTDAQEALNDIAELKNLFSVKKGV